MVIKAYCMGWHTGKSSAFHDILVAPLRAYIDIQLSEWDGLSLDYFKGESEREVPLVFCMRPPPDSLLADTSRRIVWIPMLDNIAIKGYAKSWWARLPKTLRIVAFSDAVDQISRSYGLPTLKLQYYPDPSELTATSWDNGNIMFYWNRRGLMPPSFIKKMCQVLHVDRLLFRPDLDPGIPLRKRYELPLRIGQTTVENLDGINSKKTYLEAIEPANIFLSPRACEGVGLTIVEALARGCAVFSYDGATMNEYIDHKVNGYLFQKANRRESLSSHLENIVTRWSPFHKRVYGYPVGKSQNWDEIGNLDLFNIGRQALIDARQGFSTWLTDAQRYAEFLLQW